MDIEYGTITPNYCTKSSTDKKNTLIYGYASVFYNLDLDNDMIAKGAFKNLNPEKIKLLWQHDQSKPIGKIINASEDAYGLKIEAEINNSTTFGCEASSLIKQGAVDGLSIGFRSNSSNYDQNGHRVIDDIDLFEISIVTFPANNKAQIYDFKNYKLTHELNKTNSNKRKEMNMNNPDNSSNLKDIEFKMHKIDQIETKLRNIENLLLSTSEFSNFSTKEKNNNETIDFIRKGTLPKGLEQKSFSTSTNGGGELIRPDLNKKILSFMKEKSPMRNLASIDNISGGSIDYVIEEGSMQSGWITETETRSETDTSKLIKHNIVAHELYAQPKVTQKLLDDTEIDIESWLAERIAGSFIAAENQAFINGDGNNKPFGLLESKKIQTLQTDSSFKADIFLTMINHLPEEYLSNATFLMHRSTLSRIQSMTDQTGRFIWQHSLSDPLVQTIFGIPVVCLAEIPPIGQGQVNIVLGDISSTYKIVDRSDIGIMRDPYTEKPFIKFYATKRTGADVINPNASKFLVINS